MNRFRRKRVLITGATSGIGRAGALRIAAEGGEVIATGRDSEKLERLRQLLPVNATVLKNDASRSDDMARLAQRIEETDGLDGLWLNAGFARLGRIEEVSSQDFDEVMNANLKGPMLQMSALSKYLRKGASVVLTSSTSVYEGAPATSLYAAAKGALASVARCWAAELGPDNIRVNTLIPGPIDTAFRDFMPLESRKIFEANVTSQLALPRIGTAEEAAAVAVFLLCDDSSFVTGSQYMVDGGLVMQ